MAREKKIDPKVKLQQEIANLCTAIGDRSFVIRQAEKDIDDYYEKITQLRQQLLDLNKIV